MAKKPVPEKPSKLPEIIRVSVDFPRWMLDTLDAEASRLGIPRQAVIKTLLDQALASKTEKLDAAVAL